MSASEVGAKRTCAPEAEPARAFIGRPTLAALPFNVAPPKSTACSA